MTGSTGKPFVVLAIEGPVSKSEVILSKFDIFSINSEENSLLSLYSVERIPGFEGLLEKYLVTSLEISSMLKGEFFDKFLPSKIFKKINF